MSSLSTVHIPDLTDVRYGSTLVNRIMHGSRLLWSRIYTEPYILYQNNKYYKVTDIINNQYVKEELEPYYHGEVINSIVDWPLGVQATIDTMVEVWCTQMLSNNTIFLGTVYNDNTNGTFKLYTNGSYNTANSLIFKFASSNVNTSSDTISNNYDSYSYSCGSHSNANSLIGGSGAEKPIYYIKAGNIGGHTGLVVEHSSQYNYSNINSNPIVSFYQGTFEQSELHMKFTSTSSQVKLFKLRIWHGNEVVKDLRWRFRNNIKTDANMYLWDDVTQSEMIPSNPNVKIQYYSSQGQSTHIGTSDKYILSHDDRFSDYYTVNGTITENGVIYERLVNSIDSTDVKKGIQVGTVPDTPDTLANPEVEWLLPDYDLQMTCSTPGASIYYTLTGEAPEDATFAEPVLYTEPVNWSVLYDMNDEYQNVSEGFMKIQSYLNGQWSEVVEFDIYA